MHRRRYPRVRLDVRVVVSCGRSEVGEREGILFGDLLGLSGWCL